jgi:stage IV sporulation protein A
MSINVICATDNDFAPYCGVMLTSLFENNRKSKLSVFVLVDESFSSRNQRRYMQLGAKYGQALHIVKVDIDTEVSPLIGSEEQAKNLMDHLNATRQEDVNALWQTSFFGKTLQDMVTENMQGKLGGMPVNVQQKMQGTIERMVNEDCNGLICILL